MACRSVKCTLENKSDQGIKFHHGKLQWGIWAKKPNSQVDASPPTTMIPAGGTATWESESDGVMTGTEGWAIFWAEDGTVVELDWNNPFCGKNTYHHKEGGKEKPTNGSAGSNSTVTFTFNKPGPPKTATTTPGTVVSPPPQGAVNGQSGCGSTALISPPADSKDVIIIPRQSTIIAKAIGEPGINNAEIQRQNVDWAKQWIKADPNNRTFLDVPVDGTWADFEKAMLDAAKIARGREVILLTGHGGTKGVRGRPATEFDTIPENKGLSVHKHKISDKMVLELPHVGMLSDDGTQMVPIPPNDAAGVQKYEPDKYLSCRKIGAEFAANGVRRLSIPTCNIGQDKHFCFELATLLRVEIRAYENGVASNDAQFGVILWVTDDEDNPAQNEPTGDDANGREYHELPTHLQHFFAPSCP